MSLKVLALLVLVGILVAIVLFRDERSKDDGVALRNTESASAGSSVEPSSPPVADAEEDEPVLAGATPVAEAEARELASQDEVSARPLRGRLVDKSTGEVVPDFLVEVRGPIQAAIPLGGRNDEDFSLSLKFRPPPKCREKVSTDRTGSFVTGGGFEPGTLELVLHDLAPTRAIPQDEPETLEHLHALEEASAERDFEVLVGPTYRLDVSLPDGAEERDFFATFPARRGIGNRDLHARFDDPGFPLTQLFGAVSRPETLEPRAALRPGDPRWVRFRSRAPFMGGSGVLELEELHLRSAAGFWAGSSRISSTRGVQPEVVRIDLSPRGAIEGRIRTPDGEAHKSAWIDLTEDEQIVCELDADRQGKFSFPWLHAGEYTVRVTTDRYREWTSTVSVVAGRKESIEVGLLPIAPLGTISGVLRSRTGRHRSKGGTLTLISKDDPKFWLLRMATYRKRAGEYEASFSFEDVPVGTYELTLEPLDNLRWSTLSMTVVAPAEGLEFLCEDTAPTFDLGFRAIDERSGAPIEESWTLVWMGKSPAERRLDSDWKTGLYQGIPEGEPIRWMLRARGYRPVWGDESVFTAEGATRSAEVRLAPGWGQLFFVTNDGNEPLSDVDVLVDGESVGKTDSSGSLFASRDTKPAHLEFRLEGWHVSWGSIDPAEPGFEHGPETPVYLKRDE